MTHITEEELLNAIEKKYIIPTRRKRKKYVGLEFEFPIVNLSGKAVDFEIVHALTNEFVSNFDFSQLSLDEEGNIYCAVSSDNCDGISFDCSYNTLELSFGTEENLRILYKRFVKYYGFIQTFLAKYGYTLTGMGVNPNYSVNRYEPVHSERYRMLYRHLSSYIKYENAMEFHNVPNFGMFSCASQVQLDVEERDIAEVLSTFSKLEPIKAVLFGNSYWDKRPDHFISRDYFWQNSLHGLNPHNVGAYETEFNSTDEVVKYIASMSMYCAEREGKYINFAPVPLREYFSAEQITGEYFDGQQYREITFKPEIGDLKNLRSFKFEDLTYRGTVEFRSVCTQPVSEIMSSAAFHAGLMENLHELTELLTDDTVIYHKGLNAAQLRELFSKRDLPEFVDKSELKDLIFRILKLAKDGLVRRGFGEMIFLEPLYFRAENLLSPAKQMLEEIENGKPIEKIISEYAALERKTERVRAFA